MSPSAGERPPTPRSSTHITLRVVAQCYEVELRWVEEVYEFGLLGEGQRVAGELTIQAAMLERLALIRRLQLQQGLNLPGIALLLQDDPD
jgi:hypothetical protein